MKNTKTKLISSVAVLLICFAMLIGSTFAWFTDSASTGVNKIQAGNLDVQLLAFTGSGYEDVNERPNTPLSLFDSGTTANGNNLETLWEPGKTQVAYLKIKNNGNLDLKYSVVVEVVNPKDSKDLYKVMKYDIIPNKTNVDTVAAWTGSGTAVTVGNNATQAKDVTLKKDSEHNFALAVHMDETAGNEYKNGEVQFYIHVYATQLASESDSFGSDYDENAKYPVELNARVGVENDKTTSTITVSTAEKVPETNNPVAKVTIPEGAAVTTGNLVIKIEEVATPSNASVAVTSNSKTLEVKLDGLAVGNEQPIKVEKYIEAGLGDSVVLKHISSNGTIVEFHKASDAESVNNEEFYYDNSTGLLTFKSKSFSPFVLEYPKDTWTNHLEGYETNSDSVAVINTAGQLAKFANDVSTSSVSAGHKAVINNDLDMSKYLWNPITVNGYTGEGIVTIEGNNHTIKNMNGPLFKGGFAGISGIVINDLTLDSSMLDDTFADSATGLGAFICAADSMEEIRLNNCHLKNSTIISSNEARVGGLIGWTSGYDVENNGPVNLDVIIENCSVENCYLAAKGTVGAIIGHAGANAATFHNITNCTVKNTKLHSTDDGEWRVGVVVGTANVGKVEISRTTESGNTLTQVGKTAPSHSNLYGRFTPKNGDKGNTGILIINGDSISQE